MPSPTPPGLAPLDWLVLSGYFLVLLVTGVLFARRETRDTTDYFLAGRRMPVWAVAVSIVATSMSAVTFIGAPEAAYNGNLTYLSTNVGMILAALVLAFVFIPAFYKARVTTIYELLGTRFGEPSRVAASWTFMVGRVMASGARIYVGAIPASIVLFGIDRGLEPANLMLAIGALATVGVLYTLVGGVSSVIWTDVIQMAVLLSACAGAIVLILLSIEAPASDVLGAMRSGTSDGASKLEVFDLTLDLTAPFSLPAVIIAFTLMGVGSYGVDQDLTQRMLTCRTARKGSWSIIGGILLGVPSMGLFLVAGLLLWVFYERPELVGGARDAASNGATDTRQVFLRYIMEEMPAGLTGLMLAGLFAAGLSSLNSAINAMSSTFVTDVYRRRAPGRSERHYLLVGRLGVVGWGVVLAAFACFCVFWQRSQAGSESGGGLLEFALGVMTFAYAGLIAVFLTALVTRRGNNVSVIAALVVGFVAVLVQQPWVLAQVSLEEFEVAFGWRLTFGVAAALVVCLLGSRRG